MNRPETALRFAPGTPSSAGPRLSVAVGIFAAVALVVALPALYRGAVFGDDIYHHLVWSSLFQAQLASGDAYPQWLLGANAGFGGPVFFFYGPVPFYVASAVGALGLGAPTTLGVAATIAIAASGVAAWWWAVSIRRGWPAIAAAVIYTTLPYHINVDVYQRFAYGELWSFAWLPLVFAATHAVAVSGGHRAVVALGLSYALLVATHLPTTLLASLLPLAYSIVVAAKGRRWHALGSTAGGLLLGLGLSAAFLLPAMTTQRFASLSRLLRPFTEDKLPPLRITIDVAKTLLHFDGSNAAASTLIEAAGLFAASLAAGFFVAAVARVRGSERTQVVFWFAVVGIAVFAMHRASLALWVHVPILQRVQNPWRLNVIVAVAIVPLVAFGWPIAKPDRRADPKLARPARIIAVVVFVGALMPFWIPSLKAVHWGIAKGPTATDVGLSRLPTEYRPASVPEAVHDGDGLVALARTTPMARLADGAGTVSVVQWDHERILVDVAALGGRLVLHQFHYPGWVARTPDGAILPITASDAGLLVVDVPPATPRLSIAREPLFEQSVGRAISLGSLLLALLLAWRPAPNTASDKPWCAESTRPTTIVSRTPISPGVGSGRAPARVEALAHADFLQRGPNRRQTPF